MSETYSIPQSFHALASAADGTSDAVCTSSLLCLCSASAAFKSLFSSPLISTLFSLSFPLPLSLSPSSSPRVLIAKSSRNMGVALLLIRLFDGSRFDCIPQLASDAPSKTRLPLISLHEQPACLSALAFCFHSLARTSTSRSHSGLASRSLFPLARSWHVSSRSHSPASLAPFQGCGRGCGRGSGGGKNRLRSSHRIQQSTASERLKPLFPFYVRKRGSL